MPFLCRIAADINALLLVTRVNRKCFGSLSQSCMKCVVETQEGEVFLPLKALLEGVKHQRTQSGIEDKILMKENL